MNVVCVELWDEDGLLSAKSCRPVYADQALEGVDVLVVVLQFDPG